MPRHMENMSKTRVDLVTGFLGAGKTTFIRKLLHHYRSQSLRAVVIENEFGKAGIDTAILREEQFDVTSLAGGCICCGLKVNFHDLLLELSEHYDRIIVEPSGIYTLEDFYDIMESPSITGKCSIGSILMIADPAQLDELDEESEKIVYSQLAGAGTVLVSKTGVLQVDAEHVVRRLQDILKARQNNDRDVRSYTVFQDWETFTERDYERFRDCGYYRNRKNLPKQDHSTLFFHTTIAPVFQSLAELEQFVREAAGGAFGDIIRVKGYLTCADGVLYNVNCTPGDWYIRPVSADSGETDIRPGINLIGRKINRRAISERLKKT